MQYFYLESDDAEETEETCNESGSNQTRADVHVSSRLVTLVPVGALGSDVERVILAHNALDPVGGCGAVPAGLGHGAGRQQRQRQEEECRSQHHGKMLRVGRDEEK